MQQKHYRNISFIYAIHFGVHTLLSHCYVIVCMPVQILMIIKGEREEQFLAIIIMHAAAVQMMMIVFCPLASFTK